MKSALVRLAIAGIAIILAVLSGTAFLRPPTALPANAPAEVFSAERAMRHVEALTRAPRPIGSAGHEAGREYILTQLRRLGLRPQVQDAVSAFRFPGADGFGAARVRNVVARIEGERGGPAILLNAHYDGGNTGVAAGDCGACVAAVLETARALTQGPRPGRDVILVLSDAEEMGDHGAHAFATQHPWMRDIGLALNYEAMGTSGRGTLYVTGPGNAALIDALAGAMPRGFGTSFVTSIFNAIPEMRNACDLQDYLDAGKPGLGFVLHGDTQHYHTILDSPANLDPRSVQSFGESALGMARAWGDRDLREAEDASFFPLAPFGTVTFGDRWALPLALASLLMVVVLGWRTARQGARPWRMVGLAIALPLTAALSGAAAMLAWAAIRAVDPVLNVLLIGTYATGWYVAGLSLLAVAVAMVPGGWLLRKAGGQEAAIGAATALALIGLLLALSLPGMAYPFTLPALAAGIVLSARGPARPVLSLLPVVLIVALVAPLVAPSGMIVAFMARLEGLSGMPLLALPTALTALAVLVSLPFLLRFLEPIAFRSRQTATAVLILGVLALAAGTLQSRFSTEQPRPEAVRYELDAGKRQARWITNDASLGAWTRQFIPAGSQRLDGGSTAPGGPPTFAAPAPVLPLPAPVADASRQLVGGRQRLTIRIASPRGAQIMEVRVAAGAPIRAAAIGGQRLDLGGYAPAARGELIFYASGFDRAGFPLDLLLERPAPVRLDLADMSDGLPGPPRTRPASTMPTPGATLDGTVVRSLFELGT